MNFFDIGKTGELNNKLFDNIEAIGRGLGINLALMIEGLLNCILSVIVSFVLNWKLTLIMLCYLPFVLISSYLFSNLTTHETINELNTYSRAGQIAQEVFSSIRTVFSLNGGEFEKKRYEKELDVARISSLRKGAVFGIYFGWSYFIVDVLYATGFIFGLLIMPYHLGQESNLQKTMTVVILFAQGISLISLIGSFLQSLSEARGAAVEVFKLVNQSADIYTNEEEILNENELSKASVNIYGDIEFNNVNFAYPARPDVPILRNLSFMFRAGQTTALVGPSGCGKSTCASLLCRFYDPLSGSITANGRPIQEYNLKQFRQGIGIVSQEPILFATSIYENIRYGKQDATRAEVEEAAKQSFAHDFIIRLPNKYETLVGERGIQLSGGEKQRIALARALIKHSAVLLLDEATSALDNESEKVVQQVLDRVSEGRTTIVIAHRLTTIRNAHCIYVLDNGKVIEQGTHETLLATEGSQYQKMFKKQQMEQMDDNRTEETNHKRIEEQEKQQMNEQFNLLQYKQNVSKKESISSSSSKSQRDVFLRALSMSRPEWLAILVGIIMCALGGATQPIFAFLLMEVVAASKYCTYSEQMHQTLFFGFSIIVLGILTIVIRFFQFTAFAVAGSKLTHRIRAKAFAHFLRQEVAYFDRPENSSSAICSRLSSDALGIQQLAGPRLGIICETLAMFIFALILGSLINLQVTLILFAFIIFGFVCAYAFIKTKALLAEKCGLLSERASSVRLNCY